MSSEEAEMREDGRGTGIPASIRWIRGRVGHGIGVAACAIVLALAGCGQSSTGGTVQRPTPTISAPHALVWQAITVPQAFYTPGAWPQMAVAQSNGNSAYACPSRSGSSPQLWSTHDRGQHWSPVSTLPAAHAGGCRLVVDATRPASIIAVIGWYDPGSGPLGCHTLAYLTTNGGHSWNELGQQQTYAQLATFAGTTYALRYSGPCSLGIPWHLAASSDGMRTWRTLDGAVLPADQSASGFWLNPFTGALLLDAFSEPSQAFWQSNDGGAHWSALGDSGLNPLSVVVQPANGALPWHICVEDHLFASLVDSHAMIACTADGGETWQRRPVLELLLHCPTCLKGHPLDYLSSMQIAALMPDGSLLGILNDRPDTNDTGVDLNMLYRLSPGDTHWQPMGRLHVTFSPKDVCLAGGTILWAISGDSDIVIGGATCSGDAGGAYSASYS